MENNSGLGIFFRASLENSGHMVALMAFVNCHYDFRPLSYIIAYIIVRI